MGEGAFCTPILGTWASDPKSKKNWGVQIWEHPILGPSGSLALFCSFGLLNISGPPAPPHTYRYPSYRPQTHLSWGKHKLNSFFSFPIPHTEGNLHEGDPNYGSRVIHNIYTRGNDPPHRGGVRPPSSPLHHEAKEQVQFWSSQDRPFPCGTPPTLSFDTPSTMTYV